MPIEINAAQPQTLGINPYADDLGQVTATSKSEYKKDLALVQKFAQDNLSQELSGLDKKEQKKVITTTILTLPDIEKGEVKGTKYQSTAQIVYNYAKTIRATLSAPINENKLSKENLTRKEGDELREAIKSGKGKLSPGNNIELKGKNLSFEFNVKPHSVSTRETINKSSITSTTSPWGTGITSLAGKATGKLENKNNMEKPFLSNPMMREVQVAGKEFHFGRMGYLQPGQGSTFSQQVDIMQQRTGKNAGGHHFDLRLMNPIENKDYLDDHNNTIQNANEDRKAGKIISCTIPINKNKINAGNLYEMGLITSTNAWTTNFLDSTIKQKALALLGLISVIPPLCLGALGYCQYKASQNKEASINEWAAAKDGINNNLQKFKELMEKNDISPQENSLYQATLYLRDKIYDGLKQNPPQIPSGTDGLMLSALMMKTADAAGMSVSEGCKSNKDRGTIADMMIQALEIKNAKNGENKYELLDFTNPDDKAIFKQVVQEAETRHTSANNTGVPGNMFASGDFRGILGAGGMFSFIGIGPLGKA
ncbi:hypothetical protein [uncultured Shewanella sp.]|uniref:hypothetical protein n=1 Tax=uncultured Shewanella sp. TaxID=173975 RepID=UPI00260296C1|nr:hypothetical protein [uncultured Shewanella sp.]